MALIRTRNISIAGRLNAVSVDIHKSRLIGIIGPNGSGKSTLLETLAGLQVFNGEYAFDGAPFDPKKRKTYAQRIGFLPQRHEMAWALTVKDIVSLGRIPWGDNAQEPVDRAMQLTAVDNFQDHIVDRLSGGQQARVWLARVLAGSPEIILADEPLASLDVFHQLSVMRLFRDLVDQQNLTVVLSIHDLGMAARFCDQLILLAEGNVIEQGDIAKVLTPAYLEQAFKTPMHIDLNTQPPIVVPC